MEGEQLVGSRFDSALLYASEVHRNDLRKGTKIPYVSHLLGVCSMVLERGGNEDAAIAALLHDAIEDHHDVVSVESLRRDYGDEVAEIVAGCTDSWETPKRSWRERKEVYVDHLAGVSTRTLLVSYCDKLYNARAIRRDLELHGDEVWERFNADRDDILWYYEALVGAFRARGWDVSELAAVVTDLHPRPAGAQPEASEEDYVEEVSRTKGPDGSDAVAWIRVTPTFAVRLHDWTTGGDVEKHFGSEDVDAFVTVHSDHVPRLIARLIRRVLPPRFAIPNDFKAFLKEEGIPFEFGVR